MLKTFCSHPSCKVLLSGARRCDRHAKAHDNAAANRQAEADARRQDDPAQAWAVSVRNSARWQRLRARFLASHPLCCDPFLRHGKWPVSGQVVNHIKALRFAFRDGEYDLAYDENNLSTLCTECDAKIGLMERRGEPVAHLFVKK